jgi:hypothetical protein
MGLTALTIGKRKAPGPRLVARNVNPRTIQSDDEDDTGDAQEDVYVLTTDVDEPDDEAVDDRDAEYKSLKAMADADDNVSSTHFNDMCRILTVVLF